MLLAFVLALAVAHDPVVDPPRAIDEWESLSLRFLCEKSVFIGTVTFLEFEDNDPLAWTRSCTVRVDETWLGSLSSQVVTIELGDKLYGAGSTYFPKVGESCMLAMSRGAFGSSSELSALRYRAIEQAQEYKAAITAWKLVDRLQGEPRRLAEFVWLINMLPSPVLRREALIEFLPMDLISMEENWDRMRYPFLRSTIPAEIWQAVAPTLSAEDGRVGGDCWELWYMSQPESAMAWLREQAARGEHGFEPGKHAIFSPARGFWSQVGDALPKRDADRLGHAIYELGSAITPRDRSPGDPELIKAAVEKVQRVVAALEVPEPPDPPKPRRGPSRSAYDQREFVHGEGAITRVSLMTACRTSGFFGFVTVLNTRSDGSRVNAELTLQVEETLIGDARGKQIRAQVRDTAHDGREPLMKVGERYLVAIEWNEQGHYFEWIVPFLPLEQEDTFRVAAKAWKLLPDEHDPNRLRAELHWLKRFLRDPRVYIDVLPELVDQVDLLDLPDLGQGKDRPYFAELPLEVFTRMGEHLSPAGGAPAGLAWKVWAYRDNASAYAWLRQQVDRWQDGWQVDANGANGSPARRFWLEVAKLSYDSEVWEFTQAVRELEYALQPREGRATDPDTVKKCVANLQRLVDALTPPAGFEAPREGTESDSR